MQTLHLIITGKVQGVSYRAFTSEKAKSLNLTGWVKNLDNGNVEATITGEQQQLNQLIDFCKQGPPAGRVDNIEKTELPPTPYKNFQITY
jgi:acylphosphatase